MAEPPILYVQIVLRKFQAMDSFHADDPTSDPDEQRDFSALFVSGGKNHALHYGSAPISLVWKMKESLPGFVMKKTVKV